MLRMDVGDGAYREGRVVPGRSQNDVVVGAEEGGEVEAVANEGDEDSKGDTSAYIYKDWMSKVTDEEREDGRVR